tara:strand:+ start:403207 stop:404910 length:1704 start_codon:yes stop_codon:yes gene_type:complete
MYRYSVDNAVTYTSEDFVLFRESPFACWMERLSLENPDHGIPPDVGSLAPGDTTEPQDDMADTLRTEGKDVRLIDWDLDEPERRTATLEAMRKGADFIVNGQLALGPLSARVNLLVRTSGYSELGDYLYIPCSTQAEAGQHAEFRLCFLADLLHSLQGQLPPQILIIRGGDDLIPLETESYIYHYRAVKQRFMETMRGFRKHRMPDPAESVHFGRWSDCAHEVLKQRLCREEQVAEDVPDDDYQEPVRKAAGVATGSGDTLDLEARQESEPEPTPAVTTVADRGASVEAANTSRFTLAEQAHLLTPGTYKAGPGVYRIGRPKGSSSGRQGAFNTSGPEQATVDAVSAASADITPGVKPQYCRRASDKALLNLEFIGSDPDVPGVAPDTVAVPEMAAESEGAPEVEQPSAASTAPAPSLRDPRRNAQRELRSPKQAPPAALGYDSVWSLPVDEPAASKEESHGQNSGWGEPLPQIDRPVAVAHPGIDMDATHVPSPPPTLTTADIELPVDTGINDEKVEHGFGQAGSDRRRAGAQPVNSLFSERVSADKAPGEGNFSNSLMTSDTLDD